MGFEFLESTAQAYICFFHPNHSPHKHKPIVSLSHKTASTTEPKPCHSKNTAILATSAIGICLPLVTSSVPALSPENDLFRTLKCFAAGIILGTGFMHVLPDSFDMLWSDCLHEKPWHQFPCAGPVAMFSALITLNGIMAASIYSNKLRSGGNQGMVTVNYGRFQG